MLVRERPALGVRPHLLGCASLHPTCSVLRKRNSMRLSEETSMREATGVIVGQQQSLVVVRLDDDKEVLCRMKRRHSLFRLPLGDRVLIRYAEKESRTPLIISFLDDESESGVV